MRPCLSARAHSAALAMITFAALLPATAFAAPSERSPQSTPTSAAHGAASAAPWAPSPKSTAKLFDREPVVPRSALSKRVRSRVVVSERRLNVVFGRRLLVEGALRPGRPGRVVRLELFEGGQWRPIARVLTTASGAFRFAISPAHPASADARLRLPGGGGVRPLAHPLGRVNVYRASGASWYGPGFYGRRTGCGTTMSAGLRGVAHKTLPCGTLVTFRHGGHTVRVPVTDRGPYVGGREWDLTVATARSLGFSGHGRIWATR